MTGAALDEVIVRGVRPRLDVIASTTAAFGLEARLAGEPLRETILSRRLRPLSSYDAVVIDSSPAMNLLTYNALLFAEEIVVPVAMDLIAIIGAQQTLAGWRRCGSCGRNAAQIRPCCPFVSQHPRH
jgi:chromosome partitioning protein